MENAQRGQFSQVCCRLRKQIGWRRISYHSKVRRRSVARSFHMAHGQEILPSGGFSMSVEGVS
jgi:hypothetical protein